MKPYTATQLLADRKAFDEDWARRVQKRENELFKPLVARFREIIERLEKCKP